MTKQEAYKFLELPEKSEKKHLIIRYNEKYNFFKMLYATAPNDIIRNLQEKNLNKLEEIKNILPEVINNNDVNFKSQKDSINAAKSITDKKNIDNYSKEKQEAIALLVVHTENKLTTSFPLFNGGNSVGRNKHSFLNSIIIEDDTYISRFHCTIIVSNTYGELSAAIADDGRNNDGKPSLNGCYYNGESERIKIIKLNENDTIQIGMTKMVFKWKNASNKVIEEEVEKSEFMGTIVINL